MPAATYLLRNNDGQATLMAAAQVLYNSLIASEKKLGTPANNVEVDFPVGDTGEVVRLSLTRIATASTIVVDKPASGAVQSGGSSASPGAVPAASTKTIKRATTRARRR